MVTALDLLKDGEYKEPVLNQSETASLMTINMTDISDLIFQLKSNSGVDIYAARTPMPGLPLYRDVFEPNHFSYEPFKELYNFYKVAFHQYIADATSKGKYNSDQWPQMYSNFKTCVQTHYNQWLNKAFEEEKRLLAQELSKIGYKKEDIDKFFKAWKDNPLLNDNQKLAYLRTVRQYLSAPSNTAYAKAFEDQNAEILSIIDSTRDSNQKPSSVAQKLAGSFQFVSGSVLTICGLWVVGIGLSFISGGTLPLAIGALFLAYGAILAITGPVVAALGVNTFLGNPMKIEEADTSALMVDGGLHAVQTIGSWIGESMSSNPSEDFGQHSEAEFEMTPYDPVSLFKREFAAVLSKLDDSPETIEHDKHKNGPSLRS